VLHTIAGRGTVDMVRYLVERGFNVNVQGSFENKALQVTASEGNEDIVLYLVGRGADGNDQGGEFCSVLQAARRGGIGILLII
jgi:ankyrin repeat protein